MSENHLLLPPESRSRSFRSHSLKPLHQPSLLTQRSKRTLSLPSKPVLPAFINIQRCYDNWENNSDDDDEDEKNSESSVGEGMAWYTPVVGLSCSVVIYVWSCLLAYYSNR